MTWRMTVLHETTYEYDADVYASFNELRMTPISGGSQMLVHHRTTVDPHVAVMAYRDYWGSTVEAFDLHTPHTRLSVVSDNVVECGLAPGDSSVASWRDVRSEKVADEFVEFLRHTHLAPVLPDAEPFVEQLASAAFPIDAVAACVQHVRDHMTYERGTTQVATTGSEAWSAGRGVCQDYSHITLSLLRSVGIPARYVSGYHYTGTGEIGEPVNVETHAWLEAWVGSWLPIDPTNGNDVSEKHIVVAYGRDYADVSPMRGIYTGGNGTAIKVNVTLTRVAR